MNLAGLVRLSFELNDDGEQAGNEVEGGGGRGRRPVTGQDIKGRDEQVKDCRALTESRGGAYVYTYEEPDTSAWKRRRVRLPDGRYGWRVVRPVFEGALEDLKRGLTPDGRRLDGLIVYDIDRLTRDNRHLEDAIEIVEHYRRPILDITGTLDLLTDNGRTVARIIVATHAQSSAATARRVSRKHVALQQAGIPTGGVRPFGWREDKRSLDEDEAEEIRTAARRVLDGAPVSAVVTDWNARGITTPRGNRWSKSTVKDVLRNPRVAGFRSRAVRTTDPRTQQTSCTVEMVRDGHGQSVRGQWERILDVEAWERVVAVIGANPVPGRGNNTVRYLLSGILRCGRDGCNARLRGQKIDPSRDARSGVFSYICPYRAEGGCSRLSIAGPVVDRLIADAVIAKYELEAAARRAHADTPEQPWTGQTRLDKVRDDLREMTAAWRAGSISAARYFALLPDLETEERRLAAERQRWIAAAHPATAPESIRADWHTYPLAQQRAYITAVLPAVIVAPGTRGRHNEQTIAARLSPVWREPA
jgi:DNA invertase Pin-like site-specific DNA recombinase